MSEKVFYGNWFDRSFPEDIEENFDLLDEVELIQDSDGDYYYYATEEDDERRYLDIIWFEVHTSECPSCHKKGLSASDWQVGDFYKNNVNYCIDCGYPEGILEYEEIESIHDIPTDLTEYEISDKTIDVLKRIYPSLEI